MSVRKLPFYLESWRFGRLQDSEDGPFVSGNVPESLSTVVFSSISCARCMRRSRQVCDLLKRYLDHAADLRWLSAAFVSGAVCWIRSLPRTCKLRPKIPRAMYRSNPISVRSRHLSNPFPNCKAPIADSIPGCRCRASRNRTDAYFR